VTDPLRIYDPSECNAHGEPVDWFTCRACKGSGTVMRNYGHTAFDGTDTREKQGMQSERCGLCNGRGSLRQIALEQRIIDGEMPGVNIEFVVRCEDCWHPASEGTWEGGSPSSWVHAYKVLRVGLEPSVSMVSTHWGGCDARCIHGAPLRMERRTGGWNMDPPLAAADLALKSGRAVEASWRQVDVRTLGWPHDLRPDHLRVLCLRCWARRDPK
jgi:hypothetical protein